MKIIRNSDIKVSNWSGGTTSELYIYPENSNYKDLNFKFRLSKATIEVEHSVFTPLPNVKRKLMLLDGELELIHENQHTINLKPLEFDTFSGNWNTTSNGKATDFNLMMLGNTEGNYKVFSNTEKTILKHKSKVDISVFYVVKGKISLSQTEDICEGELIIIENKNNNFELTFSKQSNIVGIEINL